MIDQLNEQVRVVAEARRRATILKKTRDISLNAWNENNRELLDDLTQAGADVAVEEAKLRDLTLEAYAKTGDKKPVLGVGVREITKLEYDARVAYEWAVEHRIALRLDVPAFEKIVKASPPDFVAISHPPQATIAADLEEL